MPESVTDRLTNTANYTGSHANRFNEDGTGKGAAGRENIVNMDGSTNAGARGTVDSNAGTKKGPTLSKKYAGEKFGSQADVPRKITVFIFGDANGTKTAKITLNHSIKTFEQVLKKLPGTGQGPAGKLFAQNYRTVVKSMEQFKDGGMYLACIKGQKIAKNEDGTYVSKGIPKDFVYIKKEVDTGCDYKVVKEKYPDVTKAEAKACVEQFNIYDANGDQQIDQNEITSSFVQLGIDMGEEEAAEYLAKFDADNSGALDIVEYIGVFAAHKAQNGAIGAVGNASSEACIVM